MSMSRGVVLIGLMLISFFCHAQRYARANGPWNTAIWAATPAGAPGSAAIPTATDDVFTNTFLVTLPSGSATCRNLNISYNIANSLAISAGRTITVTGTLNGWDDAGTFEEFPNTSVLTFAAGSSMIFTGANIQPTYDPYLVFFWDNTVPLGRVTFNFSGTKNLLFPLSVSAILRLQSGSLTADPGSDLSGNSTATLQIDAGASLITDDPLINFNNYQISGTLQTSSTISAAGGAGSLTVNSGGVLNSSGTITTNATTITGTINVSNALNTSGTFLMNAGGGLNSSFSGGSQTEGWWSNSNRPTTVTLDPTSTINYSGPSQNIYTRSYTNLTLSGSGTKTVAGSGSMNVSGNFSFANSGITCSSSFPVIFDGSGAQAFSGGGTANFNGGLQVNKSAGTLTISQNLTIQNGLTISSGTLDLGSNNVNLSGNLSVSGSLVASNSTLTITGATSITSGSPSLNNLTISGTGSFTAPSAFSIAGNLSNSGSFNSNNGTITFNGTNAQSISGTSTLTNINCNTTSGGSVSINGNVTLNGVLTLSSSGIFDADGSGGGVFTVASLDQNAGGRIAALPNPGNFSGEVTVQRFIHSQAGGDYRYLSMPVTTNQNNLSRWKAAIGVTGAFSDRSVNSEFANIQDSGNTNPSVFTWNGTAYVGVTGVTTGATTLSSRTGYVAYNYNNSSTTASYRGAIETGSVPISISNVNGNFNLVPNPYPSPIDFDIISKSNINNSLWLRTGNNTFSSYVGGVATLPPFGGWTGEIAIGQSFWTQSNGGGSTLTLNETDKTNNSVRFLRTETPTNYVRLTLTGADQSDETVVRFTDGGSDDLNGKFDAVKRKNGNYVSALGQNNYLNLSVYTVSAAIDYAIKGIALLSATEATRIVPLKVADAKNGNYTLKFTELSTFDLGYKIFLKDKFLSKEVEIAENEEYEFSITSNASTTGSARFELVFRKDIVMALEPTLSQEVLVYPNPVSSDGRLTIVIPEQLDAPILSIFLYDMKGSVIYSSENDKKILEPGVKTIEMGQAGTGLYILNITSGNEIKSIRVLKR